MKRHIAAGLFIVAVMAGVGWKLAGLPATSTTLEDIRLIQHSEHSHPGPTEQLAGIRIRIAPSDFGYEIAAHHRQVPRVSVAAE
jgi:hypothetical protein